MEVGRCEMRPKGSSNSKRNSVPLMCEDREPSISKHWFLQDGFSRLHLHSPNPGEGIVLMVLNQRNGKILLQKVFLLGHYWFFWADFQWHIDRIAPGRLVVITVSVSGCVGLRQTAQVLNKLGSQFSTHLTTEAHWIWIFIKGGRTITETAIINGPNDIHQHAILPLCNIPDRKLNTTSKLEHFRWEYCATEGVMGNLCDEHQPLLLPLPSPPSLNKEEISILAKVPVVVTAGNRQQYLKQTLESLLSAPGVHRDNVLVILGDAPPPTIKLLQLLNVNYENLTVHGESNSKLFSYYRGVYQYIADKFPDAPAVILLDEDVEVSLDFFSYMSQTIWLLEKDPTIYCINGFSATGINGVSHHPNRIFRGSVQVEWGYAISLDFVREALAIWPLETLGLDIVVYDYFLYAFVSKDRECIYPEVGRASHYGAGINTMANLITMEMIFINKTSTQDYGIPLHDVEGLLLTNWERNLRHNISKAIPLVGNPCSEDLFPRLTGSTQGNNQSHHLYVFYYRLDNYTLNGRIVPDAVQFHHLYSCFGAWSLSEQGQHSGVGIISVASDITLYLMGIPYSSYSDLKPDWVPLWDVNAISEEEFAIVDYNKLYRQRFTVHMPNGNLNASELMGILSRG